jgi:hypothetical protein
MARCGTGLPILWELEFFRPKCLPTPRSAAGRACKVQMASLQLPPLASVSPQFRLPKPVDRRPLSAHLGVLFKSTSLSSSAPRMLPKQAPEPSPFARRGDARSRWNAQGPPSRTAPASPRHTPAPPKHNGRNEGIRP